jgi:molybdopterin/thiamine biosynthesis adenylyltransferase/rhodanese-related sulfurtransferase
MTLPEKELFSRQILLPQIGQLGQQKLIDAKVLIVGAGGLGCPVLQYLASSGVGTITIIDDDIVELSNLPRQILYTHSDLGNLKVECLNKIFINKPNFHFLPLRLSNENILEIVSDFEIVIDTTDNFESRYLINDACVLLDKILVSASVSAFGGQLAVYNYPINNNERSASYRCLFNEPPTDALTCVTGGIMATHVGLMGLWQANEVIKIIIGLDNILFNKMLIVDLLNNTINTIEFVKQQQQIDNIKQKGKLGLELNPICNKVLLNVSITDLQQWKSSKRLFKLIDIRELDEHEAFNIGGDNYNYIQLVDFINKLVVPLPIVLYCNVGYKSKLVQQRLSTSFPNIEIYNLENGIHTIKTENIIYD